MNTLSIEDEMKLVETAFAKEIVRIEKLPKDKAKAFAHERLVGMGIITENGDFAQPYSAFGGDNVQ